MYVYTYRTTLTELPKWRCPGPGRPPEVDFGYYH